MFIEAANIFYISNFNVIGGTETFIYELTKKYRELEIVVVYKTGNKNQVERIRKNVRIVQYTSDMKFRCKKFFCNYETDIIDHVVADEYIQIIHAMFKTNKLTPIINPRIDKYIAVSQIAANEWEELTGIKPMVSHNPLLITDDDKSPVVFLISATRLTSEKGGDRMIKLANLLDQKKIKYLWLIFTNDEVYEFTNNAIKLKPRLDIRPYIASIRGNGYGVQLSDCEGYCYFTNECINLGVPVLITPVPSFKEQGFEDGKNCYVLPFDIIDIDVDKIVNKIPTFSPCAREDKWNELLVQDKSDYWREIEMKYKVRALPTYQEQGLKDGELGFIPEPGYEFEVDKIRLDVLLGKNAYNIAFVELVEKAKEETKEEPKPEEPKVVETKTKKNSKKK